jgi:phosphoglycerate dehydrogenase-like enzyme
MLRMIHRALVPAHLLGDIGAAIGLDTVELIPYDPHGIPLADSAGSVAFFRWWLSEEDGDRLIEQHPTLAWLHTGSAGVDHILTERFRAAGLILTNSAGVHAPSIAEWVVAMMLLVEKDLPAMLQQQLARTWRKVERAELGGRRVTIVGTGHIGSEIARRLRPFGCRLTGVRRSGQEHPDFDHVERAENLSEALAGTDWLILAVPLSAETRGLIGAEALRSLPAGARIVNVARGEIVVEEALVEALQSGRLAGAVLDVFETEPLPDDHPLWTLPGVFVLPHTTWRSPEVKRRQVELFAGNMRRFVAGEPMKNVVDVTRGY